MLEKVHLKSKLLCTLGSTSQSWKFFIFPCAFSSMSDTVIHSFIHAFECTNIVRPQRDALPLSHWTSCHQQLRKCVVVQPLSSSTCHVDFNAMARNQKQSQQCSTKSDICGPNANMWNDFDANFSNKNIFCNSWKFCLWLCSN